jgi:hypothetical protein
MDLRKAQAQLRQSPVHHRLEICPLVGTEPESVLLAGMTPRGGVAVDLGANVGYHTVNLARWLGPTGVVYLFGLKGVAALA